MSTNLSQRLGATASRPAPATSVSWLAAGLGLPALALAIAAIAPMPLVLPLLAAVSVVGGFTIAALAMIAAPADSPARENALILAGCIVLAGFAATILADGGEVARFFAL